MIPNTTSEKVQQTLSRAKKLEIGAWGLAQERHGDYRSKFRYVNGSGGIEFAEVREYMAGDDPRHIDWNVSAKYNKLYVKEFTEERDINVYVIIDSSDSTAFGSKKSKRDIIIDIGASLVLSALYNSNGSSDVGLGIFAQKLEILIPAKKGRRHAMKIIHKMLQYESQKKPQHRKTDLATSISQLAHRIKRKSTIFIISDYITGPFVEKMKSLSGRHAVVMIDISDKHEIMMPDIGYAYLEDAETGDQILVDTSKKEFQRAYTQLAQDAISATKRQALAGNAAYVRITDDESYDVTFNRHAKALIKGADKQMRTQNRAV